MPRYEEEKVQLIPPHAVSKTKPIPSKMKMVTGEFLLQCPYESTHKATNKRFTIHLEKCRRNYITRKVLEGEEPLWLSCKFNAAHQILAPELLHHEESCPSKRQAFLEFLYLTKAEEIMAMPVDEEEASALPKLGTIRGSAELIGDYDIDELAAELEQMFIQQPELLIKDVLWANPEEAARLGGLVADFDSVKVQSCLNQEEEPLFCRRKPRYVRRRRSPTPHPSKMDQIYESEEEDGGNLKKEGNDREEDSADYWSEETNNCPAFDWQDNLQNFENARFSVSRLVPPGLSKMQRKLFHKFNEAKLKFEHGCFIDDAGMKETKGKDSASSSNSSSCLIIPPVLKPVY